MTQCFHKIKVYGENPLRIPQPCITFSHPLSLFGNEKTAPLYFTFFHLQLKVSPSHFILLVQPCMSAYVDFNGLNKSGFFCKPSQELDFVGGVSQDKKNMKCSGHLHLLSRKYKDKDQTKCRSMTTTDRQGMEWSGKVTSCSLSSPIKIEEPFEKLELDRAASMSFLYMGQNWIGKYDKLVVLGNSFFVSHALLT